MSRKGFTLVELMVVILIVAILAAVAIPIMRGRIDAAKWSEGKAMMGTIATAIRAYCAETDTDVTMSALLFDEQLGFRQGDLQGTYFDQDDFIIQSGTYTPGTNVMTFVILGTRDETTSGIEGPPAYTLNELGEWAQAGL